MSIISFKLSEKARRRRREFKIFVSSAFIGTLLGIFFTLLGSGFPFSRPILGLIIVVSVLILLFVFYTMNIVLSPEELHRIIPIGIIYDRENGFLIPITTRLPNGFIKNSYMRFKDIMKKGPQFSNNLKSNNLKIINNFLLDLIVYEVFDWLSYKYEFWWAPKRRYRRRGLISESYKSKNEISSSQIEYSVISEQLAKENILFKAYRDSLMTGGHFRFLMPKGTKFEFKIGDGGEFKKPKMIFNNKYCKIELTIGFSELGVGLSHWGKFVKPPDHIKDRIKYFEEHFGNAIFDMEFSANFDWLRSLNDCSDDYFNWVEDMCDGLDDFFNFEKEIDALKKANKKLKI